MARNYTIDGSNNGTDTRNLTLFNTNTTATNGVIYLHGNASADSGSTNNSIKNCIVYGSTDQNTTAVTTFGIVSSGNFIGSPVCAGNDYNSVVNNIIYNVSNGVYFFSGSSSVFNKGNIIRNNTIGKSTGVNERIGQAGISVFGQQDLAVSRNTIAYLYNLSAASLPRPMSGISLSLVKRTRVLQNTVHNIISEKGAPVYGINFGGSGDTTCNVMANNVIHTIKANAAVNGISITNGIQDTIVYNSCYISDSMDRAGIVVSNAPTSVFSIQNIRNAFICNNAFASSAITRNSSLLHAVFLYNQPLTIYNVAINYNAYYVPQGNPQVSIARFNTGLYNLNGIRAASSTDLNSTDANPYFNSTRNLIPDRGSSLLNAGIAVASIKKDFYDSLRAATPTIGAYEIAIDSAGPAIQVVQQYLNTGSTLNRTITANIKDNTGVPLSGANKPRIYFRKMYNGAWQSTQGMLSGGNSKSGTWIFTIDASLVGGFSVGDSVYYYVAAQDSSPANNLSTAPSGGQGTSVNNATASVLFNYAIFAPVNGNYLVGASQTSPNFTTLTAAAAFIEGKIITGNVSFLIQADYDALLEPAFPIVLKPYLSDAQQGVHRITIKPGAGVNDTIISASPASSVFNIEGGAYYTIDGSNNGSRSRNLTVIHNGNAPAACVVVLTSLGANKGAKHNVIKNLNILSGDNLAVNDLSKRGVGLSGLNNDSNTIEGNYIANVAYGIMRVAAPVTMNVGNVFKENRIGGYSPVTERISFAGMNLIYEKDAQVSNNEVVYVGKKLAYNSVGDAAGIMLSQVQNSRVSGNRIHDVINEKGYSASGIQLTSSASGLNVISNNVLYNILGNSSVAGKGTSGILISASTNDSFLFNTISMQGDLDSAGLANATISAFGIFITSALNPVLNNNIINVDLASNNALTHAAYSIPTSFSWGTGSSDYNSVYINPANTKMRFARYGNNGSLITQAQWQALGQDANAKFIDPLFNYYDPTRTTLQPESPLVKAGIAITGINRDILDSLRRNPPTIGAYEYPQDQSGPRIDYTLIPNSRELNTLVLSNFATIKDTSGVNTTNGLRPRFYFKKTTEANVFGANNSAANGWKWVEAANVTSPFNFIVSYSLLNSALIAGDTIAYFVVAQDQTAGTYVSSNPLPGFEGNSVANMIKAPAAPNRLLIVGLPMSGNYNIGAVQTAPNYKTITHALADLALRGVNGPVTLTLMDTLYSTAETFPLAVKAIEGVSALNTIVLRPGAGVNAKITSAASTGTMQLNNCSYFTIDGRQNSTGNTQSLKIIGTSTSALSVINLVNDARNNNILYTDVMGVLSASAGLGVIYISGTSFANGSDSNTIRNCDVHSASTSATPGTCISVFGNSSITQDQCSDYLTIDSCRIYDYSGSGFTSSGIQIGRGKGLKITNNRFYQTATRNFGLTSSSTPHQHRAIWYQNTMNDPDTSAGILITGNMIGGNGGSGNYTITGDHTFWGIDVDVYYSSKVSIQGNTLTRLNISCKTEQVEAAIGIKASGLNVLIGNETPNTIGSSTVNGSILFTASAGGSGFTGIYVNNGRGLKMENNQVGGIDLASATASVGASFTGISVYANTYGAIKNNVIGSTVLSSSINQLSTAASNTKTTRLRGMSFSGGGAQELLVDSNSIANINSNSTCNITNISNESDVTGIYVNGNSAAKLKVVRNRIFNLSSATLTNNTFKGNLNGVLVNAGTATISNNEIHSLRYTNATASNNYVFITGVNILGGQVIVDANKIHSFSVNNTHNGSLLTLSGIYAFTNSTATISNNMIRLGLDENGSSVSSPCGIWGIVVRNETNGLSRVAHNSVYLGGVSNGTGSSITRAFTHLNNSTTVKDTIVNNIFSNMRVNSGSGIKHYNVYMYDYKNIYLNRNVYQKTASGIFGTANAMTSDTLDYKKGWVTSDNESVVADPQFVNPTGTASTFDLHLKTNVATAAEGSGYVFDVPADYDGEQRSTLSPVDIGADAGNFIKTDLLPPVIIYNPLERDTVALQRFVGDVKITDGTGIDTAFNKRPRLYFKKRTNNNAFVGNTASDNGWKYVVANTTTSPFNFTVNYALLHGGGVVLNDTIDYFVTAQDSSAAAYVSANPAYGFNATSVSNISSAPAVPNYYRIYHLPLNGLYNVGSGQTSPNFPTITAAVERMEDVGVSGKVTFNLTDNLYSSNETFPIVINTIKGASAQNTVTLKPGLPGTKILASTITNAELIRLNNVAYFKLDGSVNGSGSRDLTIDNTGDGRAVYFYSTSNDAIYDTISNAILSGARNSSALLIGGNTTYLRLAVVNNKFIGSLNGVKAEGSGPRSWLYILNNQFGDSLPENNLYTAGVNAVGAEAVQIIGNRITNVRNQVNTTTYGIFASSEGARIIGNTIDHISDTGTSFTEYAIGINLVGNSVQVINNMVSGITANNSVGIASNGIILHNTVHMNAKRPGVLNTYATSTAFTTTGAELRNNIFINSMTCSAPASYTKNYIIDYMNLSVSILQLSNNNYYHAPSAIQSYIGSTATNMADWKALTSDTTSRNVPVTFVSASDLHLAGTSIGDTNLKALPQPWLTERDIDGDLRNTVFTYMGADENTANPVPVKLLQFTATRKAADVELNWSTASEKNNLGFDVERSVDGKRFEKIGFVKGTLASAVKSSYQTIDERAFENARSSTIYYRLKQLDVDGRYTYSDVAMVSNPLGRPLAMVAFPNPFNSSMKIRFTHDAENDDATLELRDLNGKLVYTANVQLKAGENELETGDLSALNAGMYFMSIATPGKTAVIKVIKQ
ncbi:MAG: T9SS type A sorting domain-containing protein [Bacteroidota bacterium]